MESFRKSSHKVAVGRIAIATALMLPLLLLSTSQGSDFLAFGNDDPAKPIPAGAKEVSVTEHLGASLPLDLPFTDESGKTVRLRQYFENGKRPIVLQLGYYGCPMLCGLISQGTVSALKAVDLVPGKDYEFVFVSIDPSEKPTLAEAKKVSYLQEYGRAGVEGWHFLTGAQASIAPLAQAVGFNYKWVQSAGQFAHPAVIMICMPDGRLSRYLYGVRFDPETTRLSLVEASNGKIGTSVDQFLLTCFQYDGRQGKYALAAIGIMRAGGVLTMVIVAVVLIRMFRREARQRAAEETASQQY